MSKIQTKENVMRNVWKVGVSFLALGAFLILALGSTDTTPRVPTTARAPTTPPAPKNVEYRVKGGVFSLTYTNSQGNTEQIGKHYGDWSYKFKTSERFFYAYVSAQNQRDYGSITAEVWIDGRKAESSTSNGAYVIATASCSVN
jgi:hypothetical protein